VSNHERATDGDEAFPSYWTNYGCTGDFDLQVPVPEEARRHLQRLLDNTFTFKATRDRRGLMPTHLELVGASRCEASRPWRRYAERRAHLAVARGGRCTPLKRIAGSGDVKTAGSIDRATRRSMHLKINEVYLFHGTSPVDARAIARDGFDLARAVETDMFGRGAYLCECSSKGDEYARADEDSPDPTVLALLLCRVACGEMYYATEPRASAVQSAMASGLYDSVLGDREAAKGTYREFVVFDPAQIYPEYILTYKRRYVGKPIGESAMQQLVRSFSK